MIIFKYEMKQFRKYILGWSLALAICIFVMTPVYYGLFNSAGETSNTLYETLGNSSFFQSIGISRGFMTEPLGVYGFLTSFFMIAAGIFALHFGISIHTKEFAGKTSEYLFTKPHTRKEIFLAKALVVLFGSLIVSICFALASLLTLVLFRPTFSLGEFFLIANSLTLLTIIFSALGLLIGAVFSNNRNPLLTAGLIIFAEYCITSFSRIAGTKGIGFLSPYSFFGAADIASSGFYDVTYMIWYMLLLVVCIAAAYFLFLKKDVQFRS
ncbi:ABC transporter permease subunit [Clostridium perfringens]|uniref:ABC transporter permease subunit n=1 Tax=Clostridium perfringens TaxID=1502 RepID=UPI002245C488|nr:ABC transporter permease subunit [Clostridium perfringens]MCX0403892.1 ABC transporter permease [Clostridium perfringens]